MIAPAPKGKKKDKAAGIAFSKNKRKRDFFVIGFAPFIGFAP